VVFGVCAQFSTLNDNEMAFIGLNALRENSFLQQVVNPTRQRGTDTPHNLDLVLTSENFVTETEHLSPLGMSDHCVLQFDCQLQAIDRHYQNKFRLDKGDNEHLCEFLNIDWDTFLDYAHSSIDEMWDKFKVLIIL